MSKVITIAVDAMGGDNSPKKVIDGINLHHQNSKNVFYKIFGNSEIINKIIPKTLSVNSFEIIHTKDEVKGTDSALSAAKRGKHTSMWLAIESVKNKTLLLPEYFENYRDYLKKNTFNSLLKGVIKLNF